MHLVNNKYVDDCSERLNTFMPHVSGNIKRDKLKGLNYI